MDGGIYYDADGEMAKRSLICADGWGWKFKMEAIPPPQKVQLVARNEEITNTGYF
jgi:hypothetical protein